MRRLNLFIPAIAIGAALLIPVAEPPAVHAAKAPSGKILYRQNCKPCHGPNSDNGEYQPLTLIQDQWTRFFDKKFVKTHEGVQSPTEAGRTLLDVLDEEAISKIRKFAVDHAADSESPMTCG